MHASSADHHWNLAKAGSAFFASILLLAGGCRSEPQRSGVDDSMANLLGIHTAYCEFIASAGRPPQSLKDLEKTQPEMDAAALDRLFRSPHDGQPYVIRWGIMVAPGQASPPGILAHEEVGVAGNRWVLLTDGNSQRMSQEEFEKAKQQRRER